MIRGRTQSLTNEHISSRFYDPRIGAQVMAGLELVQFYPADFLGALDTPGPFSLLLSFISFM